MSEPIRNRGFGGMTPERRTEISRMGGLATPADKRSFAKNSALAKAAGAKGGSAPRKKKEPVDASEG